MSTSKGPGLNRSVQATLKPKAGELTICETVKLKTPVCRKVRYIGYINTSQALSSRLMAILYCSVATDV